MDGDKLTGCRNEAQHKKGIDLAGDTLVHGGKVMQIVYEKFKDRDMRLLRHHCRKNSCIPIYAANGK